MTKTKQNKKSAKRQERGGIEGRTTKTRETKEKRATFAMREEEDEGRE